MKKYLAKYYGVLVKLSGVSVSLGFIATFSRVFGNG